MQFGAHYFSMRTREALFVVLVRTRPYKEISIVLLQRNGHLLTILVANYSAGARMSGEWGTPPIAGVAVWLRINCIVFSHRSKPPPNHQHQPESES